MRINGDREYVKQVRLLYDAEACYRWGWYEEAYRTLVELAESVGPARPRKVLTENGKKKDNQDDAEKFRQQQLC